MAKYDFYTFDIMIFYTNHKKKELFETKKTEGSPKTKVGDFLRYRDYRVAFISG